MVKKSRTLMYVQQIEHLKIPIEQFRKVLDQSSATEWAFIIHDKDEGVKPHVHCVMHFDNARYASSISKLFNDSENSIEYWNGRIGNAYSYLIHRTQKAHSEKYQYSPNDVTANFNFEEKIKSISKQINPKKVNQYIEEYAEGLITYDQLHNEIGTYNMAKNKAILDNISNLLREQNHREWLQNFKGPVEVYWLWGEGGIGKSAYADYLLADKESVAKLGSSNDYFQSYNQEHSCILNDVRPDDFKWSDLLRILDPWQLDKQAPRRYQNCFLDVDTIIITTPYDSYGFYNNIRNINRKIDTYEQLKRRITHEIGPEEIIQENKKLHLGRFKDNG